MNAQRKGRAMGTGMDLAEAAGTPDFYAVGRLRARVAELEEFPLAVDAFLAEASPWIGPGAPSEVPELTEIAARRLQYMLDRLTSASPAPDVVPVPREELEALRSLYSWMSAADEGGIKVSFSLTEFPEGQTCLSGIANALAALDALRSGEVGKGREA